MLEINYTTGYAGTGKSTALLELVQTLDVNSSVVICPTHKAIDRLRPKLPNDMEVKTIHALLGWIPTINEDATHINHIDATVKLDHPLGEYNHIVIDEAGMMSEDMLMEITSKLELEHSEDDEIKLSLFLDPYQLLPVKGQQIMTDPLTTTHLTTQHRAESPDVVKLFTKFVNFLEGTNTRDLKLDLSENVISIKDIDGFNPKTDRLLAYTNECVGDYNIAIAKKLKIKDYIGQEVQLGNMSRAVVPSKYLKPSIKILIDSFKNGSLLLQNSQINDKYLESNLQALLDCKDINFVQIGAYIVPVIIGINKAYLAIKQAKALAIQDRHNFKWVYALGRAFTMDYTFASTVHKSQGSEWDRIWIVKSDIQKAIMNGYYNNYARLMYVAISRAKKQVFILD